MKSIFKKTSHIALLALVSILLFTGIASAHVTVKPSTSTTGAWETYTMKVPVEKDMPTTKVTLKVPTGVEFQQYEPIPGWTVSTEKDAAGKVASVTWAATGDGILPGQFQQFTFVAKNPKDAGKANWDAYQYYKDGSIVEWTGDKSAQTPHSITEIVAASAVSTDHATTTTTEKKDTGVQQASLTLPIVSTVLSIVALLVVLLVALRRKR